MEIEHPNVGFPVFRAGELLYHSFIESDANWGRILVLGGGLLSLGNKDREAGNADEN
jgi:hypothetical protein